MEKSNHKPTLPTTVKQVQMNLNLKTEGKRKPSQPVEFKSMDDALVKKNRLTVPQPQPALPKRAE